MIHALNGMPRKGVPFRPRKGQSRWRDLRPNTPPNASNRSSKRHNRSRRSRKTRCHSTRCPPGKPHWPPPRGPQNPRWATRETSQPVGCWCPQHRVHRALCTCRWGCRGPSRWRSGRGSAGCYKRRSTRRHRTHRYCPRNRHERPSGRPAPGSFRSKSKYPGCTAGPLPHPEGPHTSPGENRRQAPIQRRHSCPLRP